VGCTGFGHEVESSRRVLWKFHSTRVDRYVSF